MSKFSVGSSRKVAIKKVRSGRGKRRRTFFFTRPPEVRSGMRLAQRRRRELLVVIVLVLLVGLFIFGTLAWLSHHTRFEIRGVRVDGTRELSAEQVEAHAFSLIFDGSFRFFSQAHVWLYPKDEIRQSLLGAFPRVQSVALSREGHVVHISISERKPHALWCREQGDGDCYHLDKEGVIFAHAEGMTIENGHTFSGAVVGNPIGARFLPSNFGRIEGLIHMLAQAGLMVERLRVLNDQDFEMRTGDGFVIRAGFVQENGQIVSNAQTAIASEALSMRKNELEYIDVRFENRVYFKFKD